MSPRAPRWILALPLGLGLFALGVLVGLEPRDGGRARGAAGEDAAVALPGGAGSRDAARGEAS
ncbi:MAG: hypothetical protein AAF682_28815, partial [Planctomycetota bacterium]